MARKNPLGKIKDVAVASLKVPVAAAGSAVGLAKTTTGIAADVVTSIAGGDKGATSTTATADEAPKSASSPAPTEAAPAPPSEPVNVIEELGLDPTPVTKPKPVKKAAKKPITKIDAAADPSHVEVTPKDVSKVVSPKE